MSDKLIYSLGIKSTCVAAAAVVPGYVRISWIHTRGSSLLAGMVS